MKPPLQDVRNSESHTFRLLGRQPRRRKSSFFDRWIQDQQSQLQALNLDPQDNDPLPTPGSLCHPYLAYPHLSRSSLPLNPVSEPGFQRPVTPAMTDDASSEFRIGRALIPPPLPPQSLPQSRPAHKPSSLRTFHLTFRPTTPLSDMTMHQHQDTVPTTSRPSILQRLSRPGSNATQSQSHARSTSLNLPCQTHTNSRSGSPALWKWRPSVLGHFTSSCPPEIMVSTASDQDIKTPTTADPPRQSTSSSTSEEGGAGQLSLTTSVHSHGSSTSKVFKFGAGSASSPSLWSQPTTISQEPAAHLAYRASTVRIPNTPRTPTPGTGDSDGEDGGTVALPPDFDPNVPYVAYGTLDTKRLSLGSLGKAARDRKKKRLVIKGIQMHETRKFEAIKQWCESFGSVSQIIRMPNGDLHINFASAEVADTVCRLRANVYIAGVGSVYLSWYTGNKYQ